MAKKEINYANAVTEWKRYQHWKKNRNKKRAVLEEKYGFDLKHAMHTIRLLRMGYEILKTGKVCVDRTHIDAEELKQILSGSWNFEQVEEYAKSKNDEFKVLYESSTLPAKVDHNFVEQLCVETIYNFNAENNFKI